MTHYVDGSFPTAVLFGFLSLGLKVASVCRGWEAEWNPGTLEAWNPETLWIAKLIPAAIICCNVELRVGIVDGPAKSCITLRMVETCWNPINNGINHLSTGAGFLPSTLQDMDFAEAGWTSRFYKVVFPSSKQLIQGKLEKSPLWFSFRNTASSACLAPLLAPWGSSSASIHEFDGAAPTRLWATLDRPDKPRAPAHGTAMQP